MDDVRERVNLVELIGKTVKLKRSGANRYVGCCPFHDEKTPSFNISTEKNLYKCYGCPARGDAIQWMMSHHNLTFHDAVIQLSTLAGMELPATIGSREENIERRQHLASLYQALKTAERIYIRGLDKSAAARRYLEQNRGLSSQTIQEFGLGVVATGVVSYMTSTPHVALVESGLACERDDKTVFDRFRHRIMIPIRNEVGNLIGFAGRSLVEKPDRTSKYINSPETDLFHKCRELFALHRAKPAIRAARLAVIVEGYFDVMGLHQAGENKAVAPMGTAFTSQQLDRLLPHIDTLVFAFDGDKAGRQAGLQAALLTLETLPDSKSAKFVFLPEGEDPDSFIRANGLDAWNTLIKEAIPLSSFMASYITKNLDRSVPETQVEAATKAKEILARIKQAPTFKSALQSHFEDLIGFKLQVGN
ncbi:DNA primase [Pseudomonas asuensis]